MKVIQATGKDLNEIVRILQKGRQLQVDSGNLNQWAADYPNPTIIEQDIAKGYSYLMLDEEDEILAVFCLMEEEEPTYQEIDGAWLDDNRRCSCGSKRSRSH